MTDKAFSRTLDKIIVRLPDGMRDALAEAAQSKKRSVNAEVVARLQLTLDIDNGVMLNPNVTEQHLDRAAYLAAAKAATEAIDAILEILAMPDGSPNIERFRVMRAKNADQGKASSRLHEESPSPPSKARTRLKPKGD